MSSLTVLVASWHGVPNMKTEKQQMVQRGVKFVVHSSSNCSRRIRRVRFALQTCGVQQGISLSDFRVYAPWLLHFAGDKQRQWPGNTRQDARPLKRLDQAPRQTKQLEHLADT